MAAGNDLATPAEDDEYHYAEAVERRHIEVAPDGERDEVREILRGFGRIGYILDRVVVAITADGDRWVRMMPREEYGLPAAGRSPWRASGSTFSAFLLCGLVPLVPFIARMKSAFLVAMTAASLMFVAIGALKSRWSIRPRWYSVLGTLAIGGSAAAAAYAIGAWHRNFTG